MWHRLRLALGIPIRELQQRVSGREFAEWLAFERLYGPIDPGRRMDLAAALVASVLANIHRDPKRRRQPYTVEDFLPQYDRPAPRRQTPEETVELVAMLNAMFGGQDLRARD